MGLKDKIKELGDGLEMDRCGNVYGWMTEGVGDGNRRREWIGEMVKVTASAWVWLEWQGGKKMERGIGAVAAAWRCDGRERKMKNSLGRYSFYLQLETESCLNSGGNCI